MNLHLPQSRTTSSLYCLFEHISYLVLVLLSLILSMHLIASFYILYFSRFYIKMNCIYIFYSFLEMIYMKWNVHPIASSSKQDIFIINFNTTCNVNFLSFLYFDKYSYKLHSMHELRDTNLWYL